MLNQLQKKLKDRVVFVVLSIYLFNEERGFRYLEDLAAVFAQKYPHEPQMLRSIQKHASDERKHFQLFQQFFQNQGRDPFLVGAWAGYCDQIMKWHFGNTLDAIQPKQMLEDDAIFFQICRIIMITELRGMDQVRHVLKSWFFSDHPELQSIFSVIARDEPSHCYPYQAWLKRHNKAEVTLREKASDFYVNYSLLFWKIPFLVLNPFLKSRNAT